MMTSYYIFALLCISYEMSFPLACLRDSFEFQLWDWVGLIFVVVIMKLIFQENDQDN